MKDEITAIDLVGRTVLDGDEELPIVWWSDADKDPCPLEKATYISAGPDQDGLFLHVRVLGGCLQ